MNINVIGGGFAGVESAYALAERGIGVTLYEMKPLRFSAAHSFAGLCELVCSNSFKAQRINSAAGLLKAEMKLLGSLTVPLAEAHAVPAGGALAVDREAFSNAVTSAIEAHPLITVVHGEVTEIPPGNVIIATGPLTDGAFAEAIQRLLVRGDNSMSGENSENNGIDINATNIENSRIGEICSNGVNCTNGENSTNVENGINNENGTNDEKGRIDKNLETLENVEMLHFFDAAAPIVTAESVDMSIAFSGARYGKGDPDYLNCPFSKDEYERFYNALITAESAPKHEIDRVYEGCMPIEVLAKRGIDAPRFGPMKPVGFTDRRTGKRPYALVQLRKETNAGLLYNIVGFQTNLKFGEQKRVFSLIPGLQNAEFARYGVMHRNSFIDSPRLLNADFSLKSRPEVIFAGQITGVEGYMESAASGLIAGIALARKLKGEPPLQLPKETMLGALTAYISNESVKRFEPMGANMGILPPLDKHIKDKQAKYQALADRAIDSLNMLIGENN